jgi:hypothetical protein
MSPKKPARRPPSPSQEADKEKMTLYLPLDITGRLRRMSASRRMKYSALVEEYVADGLARDEKRHRDAASGGAADQ